LTFSIERVELWHKVDSRELTIEDAGQRIPIHRRSTDAAILGRFQGLVKVLRLGKGG
jgi:hypothetical protein